MSKANTFYAKGAGSSLFLLWIGAVILLVAMLYNWRVETDSTDSQGGLSKPRDVFVDELLLSSQDLQLGESVGLINISLNRGADDQAVREEPHVVNTLPERKLVYSKMLKNKIKKISSTPANNNGFTIKPLPQ